ncbi:hypothetical protein [Streptomyces sp. f51]|uniref:hypothetical protein n=1 Tax=Streptomyces sp. f51 TaxID=1827742 RepID=UPI000D1C4EC4|nr:hypothetical protein [Streptomyces sp. f51]
MAPADDAALSGLARAAADWDRLDSGLDSRTRVRLAARLGDFRAAGPGTERRAEAAEAVLRLLDEAEGGAGSRLAGAAVAPAGFTAEDLAVLVLDGHRMVGPVLGAVRERLLAAPAFTAPRGSPGPGDPYDARLIRLRAAGGGIILPAFQFRGPTDAWPAVLSVNELLDAPRDPWGVADWWLSPNGWLGTAPASLLGSGRDAELTDAASYLMEPVDLS